MYLYDHTKATEIGYNDDISYPSNPYSRISIDLSKNINYFVKVKFWSSSETGSYKISLTKNSTPSYTTETVSKNSQHYMLQKIPILLMQKHLLRL